MTRDILIVGAGPTGMALALELRRYGITARIIEKTTERRGGSKALSVNPATLYAFRELGVASRVLEQGRALSRATVVHRGHRLASVELRKLPYQHNHFVMIPQPRTEQILSERLGEVGIAVEHGFTLTGLLPDDDGVLVSTADAAGRTETRRYAYVVGCDGARSAVREGLGISFTGFDYPMHFLMADAKIEWPGPRDQGTYVVEESGFLIVLPLTAEHHRVVVKVNGPFESTTKVSFEAVQEAVKACVGERLRLSDPIWVSGAPFYNRLASAMRRGRVFLAGDSAHLFSPLGGYGMNAGVGDAMNLGWKLAYLLRGYAGESLLQTYEEERLLLARRLVFATDRSTSLIAGLDRHERKDEEQWLPLARNRPILRGLRYNLAGLAHSYEAIPSGRAGRAALVGCIAPFIDAIQEGAPEIEAGPAKHVVAVNVGTSAFEGSPIAAAIGDIVSRYGPFVRVVVFADRAPPPVLPDGVVWRVDARPLRARGVPEMGAALVRPDFYIEHVSKDGDACDGVRSYLEDHYRPCSTSDLRSVASMEHRPLFA